MKTVAFLALCFAATHSRLAAAPQSEIKAIRRHYDTINDNLRRYSLVERDVMGLSTEGGALSGYFSGSSPRKIVVQLYGCGHQVQEEYYFWDNRLVFVDEVTLHYASLELPKVLSRRESRYYFAEGRLIRWLDPDRKPNEDNSQMRTQERIYLKNAREWLKLTQSAHRDRL